MTKKTPAADPSPTNQQPKRANSVSPNQCCLHSVARNLTGHPRPGTLYRCPTCNDLIQWLFNAWERKTPGEKRKHR